MPATNTTGLTTDMSFSGAQDRSVTVDRRPDAGQGRKFLLEAGEPALAETDTNGGTMSISSGASTGSGSSFIEFLTATAGAPGTADRAPTAKMTFLGNGNVGIGTTSPATNTKLHVVSTGSSPGVLFQTDTASYWTTAALYNANTTDGNGNVLSFRTDTTGAGATPQMELSALRASYTTHDHATRSSNLSMFVTNAGTLTEAMTLASSGNVGIGTTVPTQKVHIKSSDHVKINVESSDNAKHAQIQFTQPSKIYSLGLADSSNIFQLYDNSLGISVLSVSAGNVGIGTATPPSALQVTGYAQLDLTSGAPPVGDCDAATERGRMKVDNTAGLLYICMNSGWVSK